MRILMVSKACLVGSYQTKLEAIAGHNDVELTVIVPPRWEDPSGTVHLEKDHLNGYQLLVEPLRFNGNYHLHYYPRLARRLREIRPDILHMDEEPYNLATFLGLRSAHQEGAKSLFFSWQNIERRYPFPFHQMERKVLEWSDHAIVGNRDSELVWRAKGYQGPIDVIPQFGISTKLFDGRRTTDLQHSFNISWAGRRLVEEKGIDLLIKAVSGLEGVWTLNIAGDGPEKSRLERLAEAEGIAERVFFDGTIPSQQMASYLGRADVVILPSRTRENWKEQFGRVLVEAMASGAVVIGSDSGEIPNVIGDAGLIFAEGDALDLRSKIARVMIDDQLRGGLSQAGRKRATEQFSQQSIADRTVDVYRRMLADRESGT